MKKYIKLLLIAILTFTLTISVNAEVITQDRTTLENYGVSKKWKVTESNKQNILNTPKVDAKEKIYDFENVLTEEEKAKLKEQIDKYIEKTGFDLVILVKNLPYSSDKQNEDYACDFYDYNDFGLELNKYAGTILFRNTYDEDPYYDFYMFGDDQLYYQGNNRNDTILDTIYSDLHSENYYEGFSLYIKLLDEFYDEGIAPALKNYYVDDMGYLHKKYTIPYIFIFIFTLLFTTITMVLMIQRNKMIHKATEAGDYLDSQATTYTNKTDDLISTHTSHYVITSSSGGGGGFHSSGGSSGGGHSSGGGRHG